MALGIPTSNILQPGNISLTGGVTRQLVSDLQLLTPQYYKNYVEKYGSEDFTWWLSTYAGMEEVKNRDYFWFENRGKLITGVQAAANVAATAGNTITLTLAAGFHYNSGTQSPLRIGETVRVASTNVEGEILTVNSTVPSAFTFTVRPKISTQSLASAGSGSFLATDVLIFGGIMDAGEASNTNAPMIQLDEKYTNSITEMRETFSATDLAEMTEVYYTGGFSGDVPAGGAQAGTSLFTLKGLVKSNVRFKDDVEMKLMRGNIVNNSGLFNTEFLSGVTPTTDFFRNFGMICPQGETRDAKDASKLYKNITIMYQQPPKGGTIGNGIRVWQWGGGSQNPTSGQMNDNVEMITYRGSRVAAANQFVIVQAS